MKKLVLCTILSFGVLCAEEKKEVKTPPKSSLEIAIDQGDIRACENILKGGVAKEEKTAAYGLVLQKKKALGAALTKRFDMNDLINGALGSAYAIVSVLLGNEAYEIMQKRIDYRHNQIDREALGSMSMPVCLLASIATGCTGYNYLHAGFTKEHRVSQLLKLYAFESLLRS